MVFMKLDQQQLLLLIKSARSTDMINLISQALEKSDSPKTFENMESQLVQDIAKYTSASLSDLLEKKSSPDGNNYLWRLLSAK